MGTRLSAGITAAVLFSGFLSSTVTAADTHKLARSNELGVEIDAMGGDEWCQQRLSLNVTAQDTSVYHTADFANLIKKLAQVLETECPQARHADLSAYDTRGMHIYEADIDFSNGELVSEREENASPSNSSGTDWGAMRSGWLNTILGWASALRP